MLRQRGTFRRVCCGLFILCLGVLGGRAEAFERKRTEAGTLVAWKRMPVRFVIDNNGMGDYFRNNSTRGTVRSEIGAVQLAFNSWEKATCAGGTKTGLSFLDGGRVSGKTVGYDKNCTDCNTNLILFHSSTGSWPYDKLQLVQVKLNYDQTTGEIFDADMEVNAEHYAFSTQTDNPDEMRFDLLSVMTYSVGLFIGLEEVKDDKFKESTMYTQLGEKDLNKRSLAPDDIEGVCTIYPSQGSSANVPNYQQVDQFKDAGCSQFPPSFSIFFVLGLLGLFCMRRR